ncbi:MAG: ParA family protein, partial [Ktedonobacteraceae bacterium]|nr:ParA family protein [Ktedonobacteraceae bacterium]
ACLDSEAERSLLSQRVAGELLLKKRLQPAAKHYDFRVIDTPPSLQTPTLNGIAIADVLVIPIETSMYGLHGLTQLLRTITEVRDAHDINPLLMALSTMHNPRQNFDRLIRSKIVERFGEECVFSTTIHRAIAIGEASTRLQSIVESQPESNSTFAFHKLVAELKQVLVEEGLLSNEQEDFMQRSIF